MTILISGDFNIHVDNMTVMTITVMLGSIQQLWIILQWKPGLPLANAKHPGGMLRGLKH